MIKIMIIMITMIIITMIIPIVKILLLLLLLLLLIIIIMMMMTIRMIRIINWPILISYNNNFIQREYAFEICISQIIERAQCSCQRDRKFNATVLVLSKTI